MSYGIQQLTVRAVSKYHSAMVQVEFATAKGGDVRCLGWWRFRGCCHHHGPNSCKAPEVCEVEFTFTERKTIVRRHKRPNGQTRRTCERRLTMTSRGQANSDRSQGGPGSARSALSTTGGEEVHCTAGTALSSFRS